MKVMIGLETHVQLNTESKLFCGCKNPATLEMEPEPNTLTCVTCLGFPGSKPRVNEQAIEKAIHVALALNCSFSKEMFFSRKTYFYPDMSKNFQITQYEIPLAQEGALVSGKKIRIRRVHVEEDPARLVHQGGLGGKTLVDYNRSGTPLIEIVTEPDFSSPKEARLYLQKLTLILEYLGLYNPDSKAVIKSDANISLKGGNRVEVKNITGDKEVEAALSYEIIRQQNVLRKGQAVARETRGWNPELGITQELRGKEVEEQYGYIFEPDLTRIELGEEAIRKIKRAIPELPDQRFRRFVDDYGLQQKIAESIVSDIGLAGLFENAAKTIDPKLAGSWIAGYLKKTLNYNEVTFRESGIEEEWIVSLLKLFREGKLTDRNGEMTIRKIVEEKKPPETIVKKYGFLSEGIDVERIVKKIVSGNKKAVDDYKKGEQKALHFLVGLGMKETKGRVDANELRKAILKMMKK